MRWAIAWTFDETFHFSEQCQSKEAFKTLKVFLKYHEILLNSQGFLFFF
jgi:hypothetical protein